MTTIAVILGFVLAILGAVYWLARQSRQDGVIAAENRQKEDVIDAVADRKAVENHVDALAADDARKRLQQWGRD